MKIGIDISQIAYSNTGVSIYLQKLIRSMTIIDPTCTFVLFFSSMRNAIPTDFVHFIKTQKNIKLISYPFPQSVLNYIWNTLHTLPIELLIGFVDIYITSDWTEPPSIKAIKLTILYDLIIYKYPDETALNIVKTQTKRLKWVEKESKGIICISHSTKLDAEKLLHISPNKLFVIHPGM